MKIKLVTISTIFIALLLSFHGSVFAQSKTVVLEPQACIFEKGFRSKSSLFSTNVQFINSKPFRVKVYWIDFAGKRQHYFDLEPNQVRWQQTFTSHPWIITESGDNQPCLNIFLPPFLTDGVAIIN
ncbi:MAG: hypothetical protein HC790_01045 [Acaryochloridaceae cyanobacterium CSU_3_4]|nr:hypothetical protein [Acaryochloridaceae cyanobacterium CSU_3_4]